MGRVPLKESEKLKIVELASKCWKIIAISKKIKKNESTIRSFLKHI